MLRVAHRLLASAPWSRGGPGAAATSAMLGARPGANKSFGAKPRAAPTPSLARKKVSVQAGMTVAELAKAARWPTETVAVQVARLMAMQRRSNDSGPNAAAASAVTENTDVPLELAQLLVLDACVCVWVGPPARLMHFGGGVIMSLFS